MLTPLVLSPQEADLKSTLVESMSLVVAQLLLVLLHSLMTSESKVSLRMYLLQLHSLMQTAKLC